MSSANTPTVYKQLVLASASPRRAELLTRMGLSFEVWPAAVSEWEAEDAPPAGLVRHNAELKAGHVAVRRPESLVLAADTTVALGNLVINKPVDLDDARGMLRRLSGQTHRVYTAIALRAEAAGIRELHHVISEVSFKELSAADIENYFQLVNPLDKAGAYGIQEGSDLIIDQLRGSLTNVMGLPTEFLEILLEERGLLGGLRTQ